MTDPRETLRGYVHFLHEHEGVRQVRLTRAAQQGLAKVAAARRAVEASDVAAVYDRRTSSRGPATTGEPVLSGSPKATGSKGHNTSVQPSFGDRRLPEDPVARSATATNEPLMEITGSTKAEKLRHLAERASV